MSYKLQHEQITPGGLNLLAPGDAGAKGDCLDLTGFWPGAAGRLEQAPGYAYLSAAHPGANYDSICQTSSRTYYAGGGNLHQVGRGGLGEAAIDTGYDGYPLGLLGFQGYAWIMNRGKQRKDDGTTVTDWTPAPPDVPTLTKPATTSGTFAVHGTFGVQPDNPDASGVFTQIKLWTSIALTNVEIGALITLAGTGGALDGTWQLTQLFEGTPNLMYLAATVPAGTVFSTAGTWAFANPGPDTGTYSYWITWQYTDLGESNPSTTAGVITATTITVTARGLKIHVDISALTPPTGAVGWNVYRQSPGMPSPYRVNGDMIPIATTTYDDFQDVAHSQDDDYLVSSLGIIMEGDHNAAPAARVMANQTFNGRVVVANSATYPNRVWYTPSLQPGFFRGSANPQAGDWVDIGTDRGDEILFMAVKPGQITVYRQKSIWRILGDFKDSNGRIDVMVPDLGIVGPRAVVSTSLGDYFRSTEGVYKYNGDWAQKVSYKLDPVFRGESPENFLGENAAYRVNSALGFHAGRLWVSYTAGGGTTNGQAFVWHVDTDRWFARQTGFGAFLDAGTSLLAAGASFAFTLETGLQDGVGTSIVGYQSEYIDCGLPDQQKTYGDLVINHNTGGATWHVRVRTNKSADATNDIFDLDTTIASTTLTKQVIPLTYPIAYPVAAKRGEPIRAFNAAIRIDGNASTSAAGVIETPVILHYYVEARAGKMFDSGRTNHGIEGVDRIDQVELDVDAPNGASLLVYGDIPGGIVVPQQTVTIPKTTGRQVVRLVIPSPVDARLFRHRVTSDTDFQVYGFRVRCLPLGVSVNGTDLDFWQPEPIGIGVN